MEAFVAAGLFCVRLAGFSPLSKAMLSSHEGLFSHHGMKRGIVYPSGCSTPLRASAAFLRAGLHLDHLFGVSK
jgi:hypothetical protein